MIKIIGLIGSCESHEQEDEFDKKFLKVNILGYYVVWINVFPYINPTSSIIKLLSWWHYQVQQIWMMNLVLPLWAHHWPRPSQQRESIPTLSIIDRPPNIFLFCQLLCKLDKFSFYLIMGMWNLLPLLWELPHHEHMFVKG